MIPSEYGLDRADVGEVGAHEVRHDDPAALEDARALERAREQLQLRELDRLVHLLEHRVHVGPGLDELGREPQRLRRRVRVLEAAGVGDERDVQRLRDLRRELDTELGEHVAQHLAGRRRVRDDEVDRRRSACCRGDGRCRRRASRARPARDPARCASAFAQSTATSTRSPHVVRAARARARRAA